MGFGGNPRVMKWPVEGAYFIVAEYIEGQTKGQRWPGDWERCGPDFGDVGRNELRGAEYRYRPHEALPACGVEDG